MHSLSSPPEPAHYTSVNLSIHAVLCSAVAASAQEEEEQQLQLSSSSCSSSSSI